MLFNWKENKATKEDEGVDGSLEHIIPNSLGGQVKSEYILTDEANRFLNEDIDKEFNSIFKTWVSRLNLKRDRKRTQSFSAFNKGYSVDVFYRNGKFFPKKHILIKKKTRYTPIQRRQVIIIESI